MTTRRRFLRLSAATAAVGGLSQCCTPSPANAIDAHVHVWTPDTKRYPLAEGFTKADMKPASFTPEELFAHSRPEGVSRIVLIQMSYYRYDNRYMLDCIANHPGVFSGVAIVDEHAAGLRSRMRDLARQGVRGFRIYAGSTPVDTWLGSDGMAELWKVAADENLNVCLLINPEALPAMDRMCQRFPRTPVVIDHFARLGITGSVERGPLDRLLHLAKHPQVHVKTSAFYALGKKQPPYTDLGPMIRECRDAFGAKRLMWASDCPFQVGPGHSYRESIALIRERLDFLTAGDRDWMLRKTAEKVFFRA
jgi:predicted TIM-barrel fold metal-dependent hydrolase